MTTTAKSISFAEIVQGRDASVRITEDGLLYAVDLVMVVTGLSRDDAGRTLRRLSDEIFSSDKLSEKNTGGSGNSRTKLVGFQDAIELVMVLPGKVARETRVQFADIIRRYLGGDRGLLVEIEANAQSESTIAQLARATLPEAEEATEARRKRVRTEDLELAKLEQEVQAKRIQNMHSFMSLMSTIRPDWMEKDERFRLQTEDQIKNMLSPPTAVQVQMITGDDATVSPPLQSLSISQLVQELGGKPLTHGQLCVFGRLAAKRYKQLHGVDPPKHRQWVDGAERSVNSYTEADRAMLTEGLRDLDLVPDA